MENNTNIQENELYTKFKELFTNKEGKYTTRNVSKLKTKYADIWKYIVNEFHFPEDATGKDLKMYTYMAYNDIREIPRCAKCGNKPVKFSEKRKFLLFCSEECQYSPEGLAIMFEKQRKTMKEIYGVENASQSKEIQKRKEETTLKHYGVRHALQNKEILQKTKETVKNRYGVEYVTLSDIIQEKTKLTNLERYSVYCVLQNEEIKEKIKNTNIERYGVENVSQSEEIKQKKVDTCLEHYGVEYNLQAEEIKELIKQTCLEKYGVEYPTQYKQIKEKSKQTMVERYGVENAIQSPELKEKMLQTIFERFGVENVSQSEEIKQKKIDTVIERFGVENVSQSEEIKQKKIDTVIEHYGSYENYLDVIHLKAKQTRRENSERYCGMSMPEYYTYLFLIKRFGIDNIMYDSIIDSCYPFHVDFYISSLDVFIEINAHWSHNTHLFNQDNQDDINEALFLREKAENSSNYKSAYQVWTQRDPLKVQTAIDNNLLYIPIWSDKIDIITQTIIDFFTEHNLQLPEPTYNYTEDEIINYMKENL